MFENLDPPEYDDLPDELFEEAYETFLDELFNDREKLDAFMRKHIDLGIVEDRAYQMLADRKREAEEDAAESRLTDRCWDA